MEQSKDSFQVMMESETKEKQFETWEDVVNFIQEKDVHGFSVTTSNTIKNKNKKLLEKGEVPMWKEVLKYYKVERHCTLRGDQTTQEHRYVTCH